MSTTNADLPQTPDFESENNAQKRKGLFGVFFLVIIVSAIGAGGYWYFVSSHFISTDNAYVAAEIAQITPSIEGTVQSVSVVNTQKVKAGETLVEIDSIDAKLAAERAEANFAKADTDITRTKIDLDRRKALSASGSISAEELSNAENAYLAAKAARDSARAAREQAQVDLSRTVIKSPVNGVVANRNVDLGQRIHAGAQLMTIVPLENVHVDANFKEGQLRKVKTGQLVELSSDLYGSDVVYHGVVEGLSGGTGSAFALIPAENATGNWIKVVQRLPVRISLDPKELAEHPLQVGLSMNVEIDISKRPQ